jgi:hypothetical protein
VDGPVRTSTSSSDAAAQLRENGRSSIAQHYRQRERFNDANMLNLGMGGVLLCLGRRDIGQQEMGVVLERCAVSWYCGRRS